MAQADFDFTGIRDFSGGYDGTSAVHSALSNPLSGRTDFCRLYAPIDNFFADIAAARYKTTYAGGLYANIPNTKGVSMRCWARTDRTNPGAISVRLQAKGDITYYDTGYHLKVGDEAGNSTTGTTYGVRMGFRDFTNSAPVADTLIYTGTSGTWINIRLDVIPIGNSADIVKAYYRLAAGDPWTLGYNQTIANTDARYTGSQAWGSGRWGYNVSRYQSLGNITGWYGYIDDFEMRLKTL